MYLQDVCVDQETGETARVLFDGGSQLTLVSNDFATSHGYTSKPEDYFIQGIGGTIEVYKAGIDRFLWDVPF